MASGKIKWFDNKKGFGFITDEAGHDFFVHHEVILGEGFKMFYPGDAVTFEAVPGDRGTKAAQVRRVGGA